MSLKKKNKKKTNTQNESGSLICKRRLRIKPWPRILLALQFVWFVYITTYSVTNGICELWRQQNNTHKKTDKQTNKQTNKKKKNK